MKPVKLALAIAALAPLACYATLGAAPATRTHAVAGARSLLQSGSASSDSAAAASYTVREANDADSVTIREYVLPTNVVFANLEEAEWYVFKRRWARLAGEEIPIE